MRVVLQVAVQEYQHVTMAVIDPGLHGSRLPEVAAKADDANPCVARRDLAELLGAAVATAVVDVEHLKGDSESLEHSNQLAVQRLGAVDLVVDQHDHRYVRRVRRGLAGHVADYAAPPAGLRPPPPHWRWGGL